jgi:deoxyadenosine/deoxycytidine kinase
LPDPRLLVICKPCSVLLKILQRSRSYEKYITAEYLTRIQPVYFDYFKTLPHQRILILDVSQSYFVDNKDDYRRIIEILI